MVGRADFLPLSLSTSVHIFHHWVYLSGGTPSLTIPIMKINKENFFSDLPLFPSGDGLTRSPLAERSLFLASGRLALLG